MFAALPRPLVLLGLSGLLPQAACLALILIGGHPLVSILIAASLYAAIILSFLGGLWWMAGLLGGIRKAWIYALAVAPSLIGWAALLPLSVTTAVSTPVPTRWLQPGLIVLGFAVLASPLVDRILARHVSLPQGWLRLRVVMAGGLGTLTLAIGSLGG